MQPIHIADIERNKTEIIRIEISEFKDKKLLNIRTWYLNDNGEYAPTKKGISLNIDKFNALKEAILKAEQAINDLI
ncbi:MAG: transcriptional coactivator p15/PC4 family protein [Spirochaetia bacterium]|nr:transcriptional coactivator p15/PC4 family protein [Spirochaetia bacterium]